MIYNTQADYDAGIVADHGTGSMRSFIFTSATTLVAGAAVLSAILFV